MPKLKLNKSNVDTKALPDTSPAPKDVLYWDTSETGFGLRVSPKGKKSYIAQARIPGQPRDIRITIGPHGTWTPDTAREHARDLITMMQKGIDPRAERKREAAHAVTLRDVTDAYLRDRDLKASSKHEIERHVTTTFAAWANKPIKSITREMVTKRFNEVKAKGTTGKGPAPAQANQSHAILRALINYAIREYREPDGTAIIRDNPVDVLYKKWAKIEPRTRRIPDKKVGEVWSYLAKAREAAYNRDAWSGIDAAMFLILTGVRSSEAYTLTWDRVNIDEGWFHLPDPKNSQPVWLPLSAQALHLLETRQRVKGNPYVFPGKIRGSHIKDPRALWEKLGQIAGVPLSAHDMRRTFSTIAMAHCHIEKVRVDMLTNHKTKDVTLSHYIETQHLSWLKPDVQRVADWIEAQASTYDAQVLNDCSESETVKLSNT